MSQVQVHLLPLPYLLFGQPEGNLRASRGINNYCHRAHNGKQGANEVYWPTMKLDVPFILDREYISFLKRHGVGLESVHFSLGSGLVADARNPLAMTDSPKEADLDGLVAGLAELSDIPRYLLVNARLQAPSLYSDVVHMLEVVSILERLIAEAGLTGIVISDGYYLNALAKAAPDVCARLEAVPSVNCMIDSSQRAMAWLRLVERSGFRVPSRLVLDRGLNRELEPLKQCSLVIREQYPGLRLLLLANEGCLPHCPYKPAHDAHLAVARMPKDGGTGLGCGDQTYGMNRDFGCLSEFRHHPWLLFTSPFIRPEDIHRYEGVVDGIKVCGRERGGRTFLEQAVKAYLEEKYTGNLLGIMDTLGEFEDRWEVENEALPTDFHDRVTGCRKDCDSCGWCTELEKYVRETAQTLPDFRERN